MTLLGLQGLSHQEIRVERPGEIKICESLSELRVLRSVLVYDEASKMDPDGRDFGFSSRSNPPRSPSESHFSLL